MPEIPEMENYRILLTERIVDKRIMEIEVNREKSINLVPEIFIKRLQGKRIVSLKRRAKNLLFELNSGDFLLLHLMLDGWLYYGVSMEDKPLRNSQVVFHFEDNTALYFLGLRLGYLHLMSLAEVEEKLRDLGPEPLSEDFTEEILKALLMKRRGSIKGFLLNQKAISGIGNAYSDEILYEAGIRPDRSVRDISSEEREVFYRAIKTILQKAIQLGGYMDNPLFNEDSRTGGFNSHFQAYGRPGENCGSGTIEVMEIAGRKAHYCPEKQK